MLKEYLTVSKPACVEFTERKSRFITSIAPVLSENEALKFLDKIRAEYRDARHNVYAYRITDENITQRFSDDGEPAGTGGMPVIEVISKAGVTNLIIVVTRYFGGILLGAPGLTRAYGKAASLGIEAAGIIKKSLCEIFVAELEYTLLGKVQYSLEEAGYAIEKVDYAEGVTLTIPVPLEGKDSFLRLVDDVTGARAVVSSSGQKYISMNINPGYG